MFKHTVSFDPVVHEAKAETEVVTNQEVITASNEGVEIVRGGLSFKFSYKPTPVRVS